MSNYIPEQKAYKTNKKEEVCKNEKNTNRLLLYNYSIISGIVYSTCLLGNSIDNKGQKTKDKSKII